MTASPEAVASPGPGEPAQGAAVTDPDESDLWRARLAQGRAVARRVLGPRPEPRPDRLRGPNRETLIVAPASSGAACRRAVICFSGNIATIRQPEALRDYPDVHVIGVRDPDRRFCMTGIERLGDSIETVSASMIKLASAMGADQLYCFGASAGGYPALRYAMELKARGALLFSPPTTLDLSDDPGAPMSKYPQLARLHAKAPHLMQDLVKPYAAMPVRPPILLLYAPVHERDAWLASRMEGVPGVELVPLKNCGGHNSMSHVIMQNRMRHYLDRLFALEPYRT